MPNDFIVTTTTSSPHWEALRHTMAIEKGTFTQPDGGTIVYEIYGTEHVHSTPLIMITGLSSVKEDWHPLSDELAKSRTVFVYDRRGIGASRLAKRGDNDDSEEAEHTLDLEANDILDVLNSLDKRRFSRVNILGWSMGGHILQALLLLPNARAHPKGGVEVKGIHVEKAILCATMPKLPKAEFKPSVLEPILETAGTDPNWKQKLTETMMSYQFDVDWLAAPANKQAFDRRVRESMNTRRPQSIIAAQGAAIAQRDTRAELQRIPATLPVLIIHGKLDRMVGHAESEALVRGIKGAKRINMQPHDERYGHFWFDYYGAEWWAQKIQDFLQNGHEAQAKL